MAKPNKTASASKPSGFAKSAAYRLNQAFMSASGYLAHGASYTRGVFARYLAESTSVEQSLDKSTELLRNRSRELDQSSALNRAYNITMLDGVVGRGLYLDVALSPLLGRADAEKEAMIEAMWEADTEACGPNGESLRELTRLAYYEKIVAGDCFFDVTFSPLRISLIAPENVASPLSGDFRVGVKVDDFGRVTHYACQYGDKYSQESIIRKKFNPQTGGLLHLHNEFERIGQVRGVPKLSSVIEECLQLRRYGLSEINSAVISARLAWAVSAGDSGTGWGPADDEGVEKKPIEVADGNVVELEQGQTIQLLESNRPNPNLGTTIATIARQICAAGGLPIEVVTKAYDSSYTAPRLAILDAQRTYENERLSIITSIYKPIFLALLPEYLARAGMSQDAMTGASFAWVGDSAPIVDPVREMQATKMRLELLITTREYETRLLTGMNSHAVTRARALELEEERRLKLTEQYEGDMKDDQL